MHTGVQQLAGAPVPQVDFGPQDLYHVGQLDLSQKKGVSFEGQGLSVSMHPEDWTHIARLGGLPTWSFARQENAFLDLHSLSDEQRAAITQWGTDQGYVQPQEVYRFSWYDEDDDDTYSMLFDTREEAQEESEDRDDGEVSSEILLVATNSFPDPTVRPGYIDPFDVLATVWAAENTDLDGVWWEDTYDPSALSCPRGVILPHKIASWTTSLCRDQE